MTTKQQNSQSRIDKAIKASASIQISWYTALKTLSASVETNGYGVYKDRSELRNKLIEAKASIENALETINATDWPNDDDYNNL